MKLKTLVFIWAAALAFAETPSKFPYCEDVAPAKTFDAEGTWTLSGISGFAEVNHLTRRQRNRLVGTTLLIKDKHVAFFNKKAMSWKKPFGTQVLGEQPYDTQSREFWYDFRTDPKDLILPRYVAAVDLELGTMIAASSGTVFFDYQGVWYRLAPIGKG